MTPRLMMVLTVIIVSCHNNKPDNSQTRIQIHRDSTDKRTYDELKSDIAMKRREFSKTGLSSATTSQVRNFWVKSISIDLYDKWHGTPWDFNGSTTIPGKGSIACGYFVTTILRDMDCDINRIKLAVCPSLQMMKSLSPHPIINNLSYLDLKSFNDYFKKHGKGVYIIGLDFHTGIIVNDGLETWFLHSNFIRRQGVIKEPILNSSALQSSKTKWVTSLTNNDEFLQKWLERR